MLPTRGSGLKRPCRRAARSPYSALLPVGLAMRRLLPAPRWALTPPFHPYPDRNRGGLFSVALSVRLPCPGVTRHHCFRESGLSSPLQGRPSGPPREMWGRASASCGQSPCDHATACFSSFLKYAGGFGGGRPPNLSDRCAPIRYVNAARKAGAATPRARHWSRPGFPVSADDLRRPALPAARAGLIPP